MTPERIREAVAEGKAAKDILHVPGAGIVPGAGSALIHSTPFGRVAQAAFLAKSKYKEFSEQDATEALIEAGVLIIRAEPIRPYSRYLDVQAVVIMPAGQNDASRAIQPTLATAFREHLASGTLARFPLTAFANGNEIRVVYSGAKELKWKLKLDDKVR